MFLDYVKYLQRAKRKEPVKINQRIVDILELLVEQGQGLMEKFLDSPQVTALYKTVTRSTKSRDFTKMTKGRLIRVVKENDQFFIEPNFQILERVIYNIRS